MYGQIETTEQTFGQQGVQSTPPIGPTGHAPQIRTQVEILSKELDAQRDMIERLTNRLEPVLSIVPPLGTTLGKSNEPTAPLAARLADLSRTIAVHTELIAALMNRVEV